MIAGRYHLEAEIGRGGLGIVYRAVDTRLERQVAVKVVDRPNLADDDRERLLHEARLAARLNHPNIIAVHDAGEVDRSPYIVMEYVDGVTAHDRPPGSLARSLEAARQLCRALAHAHAQGIVHRDLKPENILLTASGQLKLADFGLALSPASRLSSDGLIVGTVFYLAPEQIRGDPVDGRADLYALGILLYEWSTGRLPFTADEALAVLTQHLFSPLVAPRTHIPDLPPGLDGLILQLLSKAPDDRPASAEDVLRMLESPELLAETPAPERSMIERIRRGRMAGRQAELHQARHLWSQVQAGSSRTLLLSGEAGIGKSRLVQELVAQARMGKALVLEGWNLDQPAQPFAVFRQMLRGAIEELDTILQQVSEPVRSDLLRLIPEAQARYPGSTVEAFSPTVEAQIRLFESVAVLLSVGSGAAPVLIIVEDLQWADSGSLALLRYLVQQIRERPVFFVVTFRPVELQAAPGLHQALHEFQRGQVAAELRLDRLDPAGTAEMLRIMFDQVDPEFVDRIFRITEGNPFFIEEVCKAMAETGRLVQRQGRWRLMETGRLELPATVRVAVLGRLRSMPAETQQALAVAAVRGSEFESELIRRVCRLDQAALADALEPAERAEIVRPIGNGDRSRFTFTHALIPAALVEDMLPADRRQLHGQLARALAQFGPDEIEALAHHYRAAGDSPQAVRYLLLAGDRAQMVYACHEAIESYAAASDLLRQAGDTEALARTLLKLGLACSADFRFDQARRAYEEAFDLWDRFLDTARPSSGPPVTLRYAISEPVALDPGLVGDDASCFFIDQMMEGLLEIDEAWGIVPALASRWEVSDDGKRYVFQLRPGSTWSDGRPLTAGDFEYAWKRNLALGEASPLSRLLFVIQHAQAYATGQAGAADVGVKAIDDLTLEVRLERPASFFPQLLTHPVTFPLPRWVVEGEAQPWTRIESFVGNGAFNLGAWQPGKAVIFESNPRYRGLSRGNVTRVEAPVISDYEALLGDFEAGTLDGISLLQADPATNRRLQIHVPAAFHNNPGPDHRLPGVQLRPATVRQPGRPPRPGTSGRHQRAARRRRGGSADPRRFPATGDAGVQSRARPGLRPGARSSGVGRSGVSRRSRLPGSRPAPHGRTRLAQPCAGVPAGRMGEGSRRAGAIGRGGVGRVAATERPPAAGDVDQRLVGRLPGSGRHVAGPVPQPGRDEPDPLAQPGVRWTHRAGGRGLRPQTQDRAVSAGRPDPGRGSGRHRAAVVCTRPEAGATLRHVAAGPVVLDAVQARGGRTRSGVSPALRRRRRRGAPVGPRRLEHDTKAPTWGGRTIGRGEFNETATRHSVGGAGGSVAGGLPILGATFTGGPTPDPDVRVRAWLLFQTDKAEESAEDAREVPDHGGGRLRGCAGGRRGGRFQPCRSSRCGKRGRSELVDCDSEPRLLGASPWCSS